MRPNDLNKGSKITPLSQACKKELKILTQIRYSALFITAPS